jgi:GTPase SAR1 family protein
VEALYIIGEPGVGKSTLTKHLTRGLPYEDTDSPFAMRRYDCGVLELGAHRPGYPGTDTLAMNAQPKVATFIEGYRPEFLLAEGDRLANEKFFTSLAALGYNLSVVGLVGSDVAARQRAVRKSNQNATWLKGRQTKVNRLLDAKSTRWDVSNVAAGQRLDDLEVCLMDIPVVAYLREQRAAFYATASPLRA